MSIEIWYKQGYPLSPPSLSSTYFCHSMYSPQCFLSLSVSETYMLLWPCSSALLILNPSLSHVDPAYTSPIFFLPFLRSRSTVPCLLSRPFQPRANTAAPHPLLHIASQEKWPHTSSCLGLPPPHPRSPVSGLAHSIDTEDQRLTITFTNDIVVTAKPFFTGCPDCYSQLPSENYKSHFQPREHAQ